MLSGGFTVPALTFLRAVIVHSKKKKKSLLDVVHSVIQVVVCCLIGVGSAGQVWDLIHLDRSQNKRVIVE